MTMDLMKEGGSFKMLPAWRVQAKSQVGDQQLDRDLLV